MTPLLRAMAHRRADFFWALPGVLDPACPAWREDQLILQARAIWAQALRLTARDRALLLDGGQP
jgi:hypothetical protein